MKQVNFKVQINNKIINKIKNSLFNITSYVSNLVSITKNKENRLIVR